MLAAEFRVAVSPVIASPVLRRLLPAFAVSAVGDGMSAVSVAWLAIRIAPPADRGLVVGLAVAAYTLPGAAGAVLLARPLRALAGRHLVAADAALRAVTLSVIPLLYAFGALRAGSYVALLAASSLLHAWGLSGQYTLVAEHLPPQSRTAGNALLSGFGMAAFVAGRGSAAAVCDRTAARQRRAARPVLDSFRDRRDRRQHYCRTGPPPSGVAGPGGGGYRLGRRAHPAGPAPAARPRPGLLHRRRPALCALPRPVSHLVPAGKPPELLSQVLAARGALTVLASPLGTALGGPLTAWLGAQHTLLASAAATIASGLAATAILTSHRRELARPGAGRRWPWRTRGLSPGS